MYVKIYAMKKILIVLLSVFVSISAFAQSADVITEILDADQATYGEVCYLSAVQQNFVKEDATYEDAIQALRSEGQLVNSVDANEFIKAQDAAAVFAAMWHVEGGLMFRITKGAPRYAFKQFQADGILSSSMDPATYMSGADVLKMYTSCVKKYSDFNIRNVSMEAE